MSQTNMSQTKVLTISEEEKKDILKRYRHIRRLLIKKGSKKENLDLFRKAFEVAYDAHSQARRKTGEPYIIHPLEVATICVEEMGMGSTTAICALLHDTVEDTDLSLDDIERMFGKKVRTIIDGLTKISGVIDQSNISLQAENFKKILLTLSEDIRVILIKIADRLHNMRTLDSMKREKQLKIASETLYLYAPLAHRLGLYNIKTELEDLSLKYTEPEVYYEIERKLKKTKSVRTRFINQFSLPIKKALEAEGFKFEMKGRTKSIYSIYNKMKKKNIPFEEVYDVFAIRIVIDSPPEREKADCWRVYSIVTDFYQPSPERLRDWISIPKSNGYEALHTTVMSPTGKWVEVQIRSKRMDEIAEKGLAAHWKYKEGAAETYFDQWLTKIRELLEQPNPDALDFVDDFKLTLLSEEVSIFTPKGDLISLPQGATALDFAFAIHSEIGLHCIGAKVNNKLEPLSYILQNGDQVEIITSKKQRPTEDWLSYVKTPKARHAIKQALMAGKKEKAKEAQPILKKFLEKHGAEYNNKNLHTLMRIFNYKNQTDFLFDIAEGNIYLESSIRNFEVRNKQLVQINPNLQQDNAQQALKKLNEETLVIGEQQDLFDYKLAPCCNPIPGDEIFGFITINDGIKIHKTSCPNTVQLLSNYAYRVIKARWTSQQKVAFLAGIKVIGFDKIGIVNEITRIISNELNVNMRSISFDSNDGIFEGKIMVFINDNKHLNNLIEKIKKVEGVNKVVRIEG